MRLTKQQLDGKIEYREFCKFLVKRFVRSFKHVQSAADDASQEELPSSRNKSAVELELERPLTKEASINYILRKAAELQLDLRKEFVQNDPHELSVLPRVKFWGILMSLPLGMNEEEMQEVFDNDLNFDNYGNVDYTSILNMDIFVTLETQRLREKALMAGKKRKRLDFDEVVRGDGAAETREEMKVADNRKVVVEDLIFIDDLEILIYSTVSPKTSNIFVTSLQKTAAAETTDDSQDNVRVIDLADLGSKNLAQLQEQRIEDEAKKNLQKDLLTNHYQLIAKFRGHKNSDPPSICYIPQSNCLVSAEKNFENEALRGGEGANTADDPEVAPTHIAQKSRVSSYERFANRHNKEDARCEILIWNIQKDMIELFSARPPWSISACKRFIAHDASIIDICYLTKAQLLVTSSLDQTIRFWDPVSTSYALTDPQNNPHAQMKPGYYKPMKPEATKSNTSFKEVKRIYTESDTVCYALRNLTIQNIILNPKSPEVKSVIEWLVCLKLSKPSVLQHDQAKAAQMGFVCGYGIERVKIEVPALHHDDIVPPYVVKECEELIAQRRQQLVTAFQHMLPVTIEKIYSQVQLQNSYIERVRKLFMQAILNRKDEKFVNPEPLREAYKIITKLPTRTKFESFLASTGCSDKLSVSETFFYMQKFMQIHPLRTTQIEFEKSIEDFYQRHQRQFLRGVKRWPKAPIQKFANFIRQNGLNINYLQEPTEGAPVTERMAKILPKFCTRERFQLYFHTEVRDKGGLFSDEEIDVILTELDPYFTGVIQIALTQRFYSEEMKFNKQVNLNRPQEVLQEIRSTAFPAKRIALQQSLAAADETGDGYVDRIQFVDAFYRAGVSMRRENLEFLFDVMSERFNSPEESTGELKADEKFLNLMFFVEKLFTRNE